MKNTFYLCLMAIVLLSITIGCSKEEILTDGENVSNEQKETNVITEGFLKKQQSKIFNQNEPNISTQYSSNDYTLYLNMDVLETQYLINTTNPILNKPFNIFFRDLMSNYFTVYSTQASNNPTCGNIELWVVNGVELNQFLVSTGLSEEKFFRSWFSNNTGGNTSNTVVPDGDKKPKPKNTLPTSGIYYSPCFGNSINSN